MAATDLAAPPSFAAELRGHSFSPGWDKPEPSLWPSPRRPFAPFHWRFADARAFLHDAGSFVSVEVAERRNLICVNPKVGNTYASTPNLVAAYQMVLPHEGPRAHRHSPSALRVAIDIAPGTFTVVDGVRVDMAQGDVLLTPNGRWHSHGNDSDLEAYWVDILDVPLIHHFGAMFFEQHPDREQTIGKTDPASSLRISAPDVVAAAEQSAPGLRRAAFGADHLRSIGLEAVSLAAGTTWARPRATVNDIFVVLSGELTVAVEDRGTFTAARGDVVAVPLWWQHDLSASSDAVLLRATDEPLIRHLSLYREEQPA